MSLQSLCSGSHSVILERPAGGQDASGGPTRDNWTAVGGAVSCDIQPAGGNTQLLYAQRQMRVTHQVYLTSDISGGHRLAGWRFTVKSGPFAGQHLMIQEYQNEVGRGGVHGAPWVADVLMVN